jgi:hypothetical protein
MLKPLGEKHDTSLQIIRRYRLELDKELKYEIMVSYIGFRRVNSRANSKINAILIKPTDDNSKRL